MDQLNLFPEKVEGASDEAVQTYLDEFNAKEQQQQEDEIEATAQAAEPEDEPAGNVGTEREMGQVLKDAGLQDDLTPVVTDFIDKTLGTDLSGFYEQRKADTAEQREAIAARAEEFRKNQPEAVKVVTGALKGVGEKALGLGEVIGDTSKTLGENVVKFASFQTIKPDWTRGGKDNPFAGNYDWATWNLGKDEYGAQTKIGRGIQDITEFGLTMALTGGFAGGGTTAVGNIIRGGARGVAADAISAVSGEGNFSNSIEENFPELKDTWLTALAIDKEDNVYTAATKTALEGFGMGAAIETAARIAWRGTKYGYKKGKDFFFPEEEVKPPPPRSFNIEKVGKSIIDSGNTERFERFSQIQDLEAAGIPTTWDDAAAVVPEYFQSAAPGLRREIKEGFAVTVYEKLDALKEEYNRLLRAGNKSPDVGASLDPFTGEEPLVGHMVAIDGAVLEDPNDLEAAAAFIMKHQDMLRREDVYLGSWISKQTKQPVVELSRLVEDEGEAVMLGRLFDQEGIFELTGTKGFDGYMPTDGKDALRQTKGQHLKSAYTTPHEPTITPAPKVAAQQIEAKLSPAPPANGGGGGRLATNAQVKQIAQARGDEAAEVVESLIKTVDVDESDIAKEARITISSLRDIVEGDLANFLDVDGKLIKDAFSTINYGDETILSRRGAFQVRAMMANTASAIYDAAYKVAKTSDEGIPPDMHVEVLKDNLMALLRMHKHTSNLLGTRLGDYSINVGDMNLTMEGFMNAASPQKLDETIEQAGKQLEDMVKGIESGDPKALQKAQRTAAMLQLTGGDVTKMVDVAQNMGTLGTDAALKLMYNSMLSAPPTHIVNNLSNAFNVVYRPLTAMVGGNAKTKKAAIASYHNFFKTIPEAFELAMRTSKTGISNVGGSRDLIQQSQTTAALKELSERAKDSNNLAFKAGSGLVHMLHNVANFPLFAWPERFLTSSDEFFKVMVTRMEFNRLQMEKAIDLAGSEGDSAVEETFKRLLKSEYQRNFTKSGGLLNDELLKGAKEVTFQTELDGKIAKFGEFVNEVPALRIFFPFVKTGHNVLVYTGTHIPVLNLALKESRDVLFTDTFEGAVMRGRLAFGSMTILGAATLVTQGLITGNGPAGGNRRKQWLEHHQPRSIRVGDRWVSYDRIEPFGQIFAAVADIHYAFTTGDLEEDKATYLAGYLSHALAVNLTDKSMLQGLEPMSALLNARQFSPDTFLAFGAKTTNSFLPLSGARRALTNAMHPYMQEFNNQFERELYSASLGVLGERAESHDWLTGEKITAGNGGVGNANLPFKVVKRGDDVVKDALEDIEFDTGIISDELGGVELTPAQKSKYQLYISQTGIYDKIKAWVTQPSFKEAHQEYVQRLRDGHRVKKEDQYFYRQITKMLRESKKIAVLRLRNDYPDLNAEIMLDKYAAQSDRLPNGYQSLINFGNE